MRQRPRGRIILNRRCDLTAGAQAILLGGCNVNLVSGAALRFGGSGAAVMERPVGTVDAFRNNFWKISEMLPALGTSPHVEFWMGYNHGVRGSAQNGRETHFVTGSSNNTTGIALYIEQNNSQGGEPWHWGSVYNWSQVDTSVQEVLANVNKHTILLSARYPDHTELWQDGKLARIIPRTPINYAASTFMVGAFVENSYWASWNDHAMSGRIRAQWSTEQIKSFFNNPWQIFDEVSGRDEEESFYSQTLTPAPRSLYLVRGGFSEVAPLPDSKPLVMVNGVIRERVTNEGVILTLQNGRFQTTT
jgi:hypothetical protein